MGFYDDLDPLVSFSRKGTSESPYADMDESLIVDNGGKVQLTEFPNRYARVSVEGDNKTWYETTNEIPTENEYVVDYQHKTVTFHQNNAGKQLRFLYSGMGGSHISVKNIYTQVNDGVVTQTLEDLTNEATQQAELVRDILATGNVTSVNGQTGIVDLNNDDVNAYSKTETYTKTEIDGKTGNLSDLNTQNKTSLVDAVNETASQLAQSQTDIKEGIRAVQRGGKKTPVIVFTDDDGRREVITKLKPILQPKGVPLTVAIPSSRLTNNSSFPNNMNLDEAKSLEAIGWEIASHGVNHLDMDTLTEPEIEYEQGESYRILNSLGLNVKNAIYPHGRDNEIVRRATRKYYRSGVSTERGINTGILETYKLKRISFGSFFDTRPAGYPETNTLEYYKKRVDEAVEQNGMLIFMMHCAQPTHDETQQQHLRDLIDYIQSLGVPTMTLNEALNHVGNVVDLGDSEVDENYYLLSSDGQVKTSLPDVTYIRESHNGRNNSSPITEFKRNYVTSIVFTIGDNGGFPENAGVLETYNLSVPDFAYQVFSHYASNKVYRRRWVPLNNAWGNWEQIAPMSSSLSKLGELNNKLDFGTVPANGQKEVTVTISGAKTTDIATASPKLTFPNGLMWGAYISANDTVTVRVVNVTTSDVFTDPRDWHVRLIR